MSLRPQHRCHPPRAEEGPSREELVDPPHHRQNVIVIGGRRRTVDAGSRHAEQRTHAKLPHAVLIGEDGTVLSKGLVNSREHLESLVTAHEMGVVSVQDYLKSKPKVA